MNGSGPSSSPRFATHLLHRMFAPLVCVAWFACAGAGSSTKHNASGDDITHPDPDDLPALGALLGGEGLVGWMHAAVPEAGLFVFTYRKPGDFFAYVDLPLIPSKETYPQLARLHRHDKVRLFGKFADNDAAKPHVRTGKIELLTAYVSPYETPKYDRKVGLPDGIPDKGPLIAKVHAVDGKGSILVIEWQDAVIPVQVQRPEHVRDLWRNDKVRLHVVRAEHPKRPGHLRLDPDVANPVQVLDTIVTGHGQSVSETGTLVLFPKSPQITFDIYALQVEGPDGLEYNYTLVNFEDMKVFDAIRKRLGEIWKAAPEAAINGRNKLAKPGLKLQVKGILNVVSPSQANPQILLSSPDDIRVLR